MNRIQKNDTVIVICGKDKGKTGRVKKVVVPDRVIVERVNVVKRHRKAAKDYPGGIEEKELSIHVSNVMLIDPKSKDRTRVKYDGAKQSKHRISKKSGEAIGTQS